MRAALFTKEFPPNIYGGAGVHVEYLSRELAKKIEVEVHCWGDQHSDAGNLHVRGGEPWAKLSEAPREIQGRPRRSQPQPHPAEGPQGIDVVHTHTWYVSMAGFLAKKLYDIPFVLTTHSLEPLRAWKAEQLGSGYAMSSWMERTAILDADAIIAVSNGTKADILRAYPDVDRRPRFTSSTTASTSTNTRRPPTPPPCSSTAWIPPRPTCSSSAASRARKA